MRRLLIEIGDYVVRLSRAIRRGWDTFFFTPADPTSLGLIRIATGFLGFWSLFVLGLDLPDYLGSSGWAEPGAIRAAQQGWQWSFWFLVPDGALRAVWIGCLIVLAMFSVGLFSRATAVLSWVIVVSTIRRVPIALYGFDQVLSPVTLYLAATSAAGQALSLDRFLRRWRQARSSAARPMPASTTPEGASRRVLPREPAVPLPTVGANLALRLIQLHLVVIYASAGLGKLQGPSWWNGMALWGTMTAGEFVVMDFTPMARWPMLINFLTHTSLALELLYPVLVWVSIARPLMLVGIIGLHAGIGLMSPGLAEFSAMMIAANLSFVSGKWLRGLVSDPDRPPLKVLFDGACPRCRATMAMVMAAEPGGAVEPIDLTAVDVRAIHPSLTAEDCLRSMHAVNGRGRISAGFDAVLAIGARLPLFWIPATVGSLPGVASAGRSVYNRIAASRPRDVPCTDQACGIHPAPRSEPLSRRGRSTNHHQAEPSPADAREVPRP